jgi:rhodanese-related sulfurtransferase
MVVGLAVAAAGAGGCLRERGVRTFDEIAAAQALQQLGDASGLLVQVRQADSQVPRVAGASLVDLEGELSGALLGEQRLVVLLAPEEATARRFAARLVRAGVPRVAVVRGGIQAWMATTPAGRPPSSAERGGDRNS